MTKETITDTGLKVGNYKCFGTPQGFEQILRFNIIIGRNNTGKSALLDLLAYIVTRQNTQMLTLDGKDAEVLITGVTTPREIDSYVPAPTAREKLIGRQLTWVVGSDGKNELRAFDESTDLTRGVPHEFWAAIARNKDNPFRNYHFKRLTAERDIRREASGLPNIHQTENGDGATRSIHHFRTHASRTTRSSRGNS